MTKEISVFKFGGSSLKDARAVKNVGKILSAYKGQKILVVVSAMGKTTNAMEEVIKVYYEKSGNPQAILYNIYKQHLDILDILFPEDHQVFIDLKDLFNQFQARLQEPPHDNYDFVYDQIVGLGELAASVIVSHYLNLIDLPTQRVDAGEVIITDDIYREGWVQWEETSRNCAEKVRPLINDSSFVLTQGFIGSTKEGQTTTLGREGSDYTAAIFSFCLDVESMTIWKDVPGVLTADPRLFNNVTKLDRLSYKEAIEMTYYGAKVIHPKTIKPLQNKSIPLFVRSFMEPEGSGTLISNEVEDTYPPMVAVETDQAVLQISTRDFSFVAEHHISYLFNIIAELRLQVNLMQNTAISFSVCVNDIDDRVDRFAKMIEKDFKVMIDRNLQLISVRHYQPEVLHNLKQGKILLLESVTGKTVQMVVKDMRVVDWKPQAISADARS